jgi:type I restriction enzyme S subunit
VKAGWVRKPLDAITTKIGSGATPSGGEASYKQAGISLIRSMNVHDVGFRDKDLAYIDQGQADLLSNVEVEPQDVLLNITGASVARCCTVPIKVLPARVNQHVSILRPASGIIGTKFLYYLLISPEYKKRLLQSGEAGSTRQALTKGLLECFEIGFPESIREQERIVAILDKAFEGIDTAKANAEKNLQNARNIFIYHLETVFNRKESEWINKSISELAEYSLGKMLDKQKNRGELRPYLRNVNVRWFDFDLSDVLEMRFLPNESDKYRVSAGDVVVCEGGYPGRAAIWIDEDPMYFQKALHRVRFHEPIHSKWFVFYLYSQSCSGRLNQHFTGSGIQHFTGAALGRFTIPVAPKKQMIELIKVMEELQDQVQNLEAVYQNKLALLETLKQSLLHQAFTGKL